jgi:glycosyltransferase involved in cell wall biosynthesis
MPQPLRSRPHGLVIPAYNAGRSLGSVLEALQVAAPNLPILAVDDGSSDDTAACASARGALVVRHAVNCGKGAALMTGLTHARDALGWEWAITLDADGQHDAADLEGFFSATPAARTGILAGVRRRRGTAMPWHRRFSNASTTWLVSRLAGAPVFDAQCGYRAYRLDLVSGLPDAGRFEWEAAALILAARGGWGIEPVPVRTLYGEYGSHMDLFRDTLRFLRMAFGPGGMAWTR